MTTGSQLPRVPESLFRLLLCGVRPGMYGTFEHAGLIPEIGEDALFVAEREMLGSTRRAVRYARALAANV